MKFFWYELKLSGPASYYCFDCQPDYDFWAAGFKQYDTLEACIEAVNKSLPAPNGFGTICGISQRVKCLEPFGVEFINEWCWNYGSKKRPKILVPLAERIYLSVDAAKLAFEKTWVEAEF